MRISFAILLALVVTNLQAAEPSAPTVYRGAETVEVVTPYVYHGDLRTLPIAPAWRPGDPIKEIPRRFYPRPQAAPVGEPANPVKLDGDPLLDAQAAAGSNRALRAFSTPDLNFNGQGFTGVNPPDTVGDVGANYYIQMINASGGAVYTIYDKSDGSVVAGPTFLDSLGSGFCASGLGDPIVLYDHLAGRWMLSEFSNSGNRLCVYVSQTGDPIAGGWYVYDFQAPSFPDYPKYAVWPDAYYVTTNESQTAAYALERSQMLAGNPATNQRFTVPDLAGFGFQALTPGDLDGQAPPPGSPNYMMRHRDDEVHNSGSNNPGSDFLEVWEFAVDFANPANSSLTGPLSIPVAEFDSSLCGLVSFNCFQQPGTGTTLDPLREVIMWRLQYRNFGSHETLVSNLVTDVNGADLGGIRWFELRKTAPGGWGLFQEGTYSPDADSRFMGSAAMDGSGNIAVGYNVSSSSTFPGLRYAGRLEGDALGALPQGENVLVNGSASNNSNRYGDYSSLNVDPVDDCSIWFTGEYNTSGAWSTRIGRFQFDGCGGVCGNNVIEAGEVCDGTDLGGASCASEGCAGGTLACNASCTGFDTSACTGCPSCDFDGVCEFGEDCTGCSDCVSGTSSGAACGNGVCETGDGENCLTCAQDCNGRQNGKPANRFCCGDGATGAGAVDCSDSRCSTGGFMCTSVPQPGGTFCCGLFGCESGESCGNCALDCSSGAELCSGGIDEDCDLAVDCDDPDCVGDPACAACTLGQPGDACTIDADCCSSKCKGKPGAQTCR